jgi:hypothetical protein
MINLIDNLFSLRQPLDPVSKTNSSPAFALGSGDLQKSEMALV